MPLRRFEWNSRIKSVELEFRIARLAFDRLLEQTDRLSADFKYRNVAHASALLEGTYIIRLFAEFETGLRLYWRTIRITHPKAEDLINGIAARRGIPDPLVAGAQSVRAYRNDLIHEREDPSAPVPIAVARDHLCAFFYRLPPDW